MPLHKLETLVTSVVCITTSGSDSIVAGPFFFFFRMQLFRLQLEVSCSQLSFLAYSFVWEFFAYNSSFLTYSSRIFSYSSNLFAYSGKVFLISSSTDYKQSSTTVSKRSSNCMGFGGVIGLVSVCISDRCNLHLSLIPRLGSVGSHWGH